MTMFRMGSLEADRHIKKVFEENVKLFVPIIEENYVLMQNKNGISSRGWYSSFILYSS